jgi:hypothetical protein
MKKLFVIVLILGLCVCSAAAYTRITTSDGRSPRWASMPISYWISELGSDQIANESEFVAIHKAFKTWQDVATANVRFDYRGTTPTSVAARDGVNVLTFADTATPLGSSVLATTFMYFENTQNGLMTSEADIVFNQTKTWATNGDSSRYDIQAIATHEIGHLLGLDHSGLMSSVMFPFATKGAISRRFLQYDDKAGVTELYPGASPPTGQIRGTITHAGAPVFGGHVVATNSEGTPLVTTITRPDGTYLLRFLPPDTYRVYVEPLDEPVTEEEIGGFYTNLNKTFGTTYYGDAPVMNLSRRIEVRENEVFVADIQTFPNATSGLNIETTHNGSPLYMERGDAIGLGLYGTDLTEGASYTPSYPGIIVPGTSFSSFSQITSVVLRAPLGVPAGPKNIEVSRGTDASVGSGFFVVQDSRPDEISLTPNNGAPEGFQYVTIQGRNFRPGAEVFFAGLPALEVRYVSSTLLEATTPPNPPMAGGVLVVNTDGTYGTGTYTYIAGGTSITSISPSSGPPGTVVVIEGKNFEWLHSVYFNTSRAVVTSGSSTRLVTAVPYGATTGAVTVGPVRGPVFTVTAPLPSTNQAPATYDFIDASVAAGGTPLSFANSNDGIAAVTLPIGFTFFNHSYPPKQVSVSTNGWLSPDASANPAFQNPRFPAHSATVPLAWGCVQRPGGTVPISSQMIAPFFDDLAMVPGRSAVTTRLVGSAPDRRFVVQWSDMTILDENGCDLHASITFEAVLFEGSNDIQFVYRSMSGPRSKGSSATIGLQGASSLLTSFDRNVVTSGSFVTYRFNPSDSVYYVPIRTDSTPPSVPEIRDGEFVRSLGELTAWWISDDLESDSLQYEWTVGTFPGASDVLGYVLRTGFNYSGNLGSYTPSPGFALAEQTGATFYFSVRAINREGLVSDWGYSDGVRLSSALAVPAQIIPYATHNSSRYTGIALLSSKSAQVHLRAVDASGLLRHTRQLALTPGRQVAKLFSELFPGTYPFEGWIEIVSDAPGLQVFTAIGSWNLDDLDGVVPRASSPDFVAMHPQGTLVLVNPASIAAEVTVRALDGALIRTLSIPALAQVKIVTGSVSRVTSTVPLAATEILEAPGRLSFSVPEPVSSAGASLTFVDGLIMDGYSTRLSLANLSASSQEVTIRFSNFTRTLQLDANSSRIVTLDESLGNPGGLHRGSISITALTGVQLLGAVDLETASNLISYGSRPMGTEFTFGHVAHGSDWFTGLCLAAGNADTTVTIDVYSPDGATRVSATVRLAPNQQIARLLSELVPDFATQIGGYVRVRSDQPILAWTVYGTQRAFSSSPPL